ncbi:MAG: voltage-gated sodium channel [Alteromonadaceae bacterium]|jgi:voltage-gated sodium channel
MNILFHRNTTTIVILFSVAIAFISSFSQSMVIHMSNWGVIAYFLLELAYKVKLLSWREYISSYGHKFDFVILIISIGMLISPNVELDSLVYLRVFRIMSLFRIIKLIPNAEHIIRGVSRAVKASKTVTILLGVMLIFFSMLGYTLFSSYLPEFFGDPLKSMNTVFTIFTVENWGAVPAEARKLGVDSIYYAVNSFVITVLILGGFIALSLANAVFVDEMASDNNDDLKLELKRIREENTEIKLLLIELKNNLKE